jgi:hypothetical protein
MAERKIFNFKSEILEEERVRVETEASITRRAEEERNRIVRGIREEEERIARRKQNNNITRKRDERVKEMISERDMIQKMRNKSLVRKKVYNSINTTFNPIHNPLLLLKK